MSELRPYRRAERRLLQVPELWREPGLFVKAIGPRESDLFPEQNQPEVRRALPADFIVSGVFGGHHRAAENAEEEFNRRE